MYNYCIYKSKAILNHISQLALTKINNYVCTHTCTHTTATCTHARTHARTHAHNLAHDYSEHLIKLKQDIYIHLLLSKCYQCTGLVHLTPGRTCNQAALLDVYKNNITNALLQTFKLTYGGGVSMRWHYCPPKLSKLELVFSSVSSRINSWHHSFFCHTLHLYHLQMMMYDWLCQVI